VILSSVAAFSEEKLLPPTKKGSAPSLIWQRRIEFFSCCTGVGDGSSDQPAGGDRAPRSRRARKYPRFCREEACALTLWPDDRRSHLVSASPDQTTWPTPAVWRKSAGRRRARVIATVGEVEFDFFVLHCPTVALTRRWFVQHFLATISARRTISCHEGTVPVRHYHIVRR
jgi:hypothetical protein